jgi:hypothetical protein
MSTTLYQIQARTLAGLASLAAPSCTACSARPSCPCAARGGLKGILGCVGCGSGATCPCKAKADAATLRGLADITDTGDQLPAADSAPFTDMHWVPMVGLACLALYLAWPKPERERQNVRVREARRRYFEQVKRIREGKEEDARKRSRVY